jgi:hypothetical protein
MAPSAVSQRPAASESSRPSRVPTVPPKNPRDNAEGAGSDRTTADALEPEWVTAIDAATD